MKICFGVFNLGKSCCISIVLQLRKLGTGLRTISSPLALWILMNDRGEYIRIVLIMLFQSNDTFFKIPMKYEINMNQH